MANQALLTRSNVAGRVPTTATLPVGALALNTADGILFAGVNVSGSAAVKKLNLTTALDITGVLGFTPVNKAGDTMTGALTANSMLTAASNLGATGFGGTYPNTGMSFGWNLISGSGESSILLGPQGGSGGLSIYQLGSNGLITSGANILNLGSTGNLTVPGALITASSSTIGVSVPNMVQGMNGLAIGNVAGAAAINVNAPQGYSNWLMQLGVGGTGVARIEATGNFYSNGSVNVSAGFAAGNATGANNSDLSKHLALFGGQYGVSVTGGRLNLVANAGGAAVVAVVNGLDVATFSAAGISTAGTITTGGNTVLTTANQVSPATVAPLINGTAAVGTSALYARQDHVHPSDTSRLSLTGGTMTGGLSGTTASFSSTITASGIIAAPTLTAQQGLTPATYAATQGGYVSWNEGSPGIGGEMDFINNRGGGPGGWLWSSIAPGGNTLTRVAFMDAGGNLNLSASLTATTGTFSGAITSAGNTVLTTANQVSPSTAAPIIDGTATVGASALYARQDHIHPTDTSRATVASVTAAQTTASNALPLTGGALTGTLYLNNGDLEIGSSGTVTQALIDFHSAGGGNDYDVRVQASGGTAGTNGKGALTITAANLVVNAPITATSIFADASAATVLTTGGAAYRTLAARFSDEANVLDFGADATGAIDSAPAFALAFATAKAVFVPSGTYKISSTILPNRAVIVMRGAGMGKTVLMNSTPDQATIQMSSNVSAAEAWISDMTLDRSVTATSGGHGFRTDAANSFTSGLINLYNILSQHNYIGFVLGNTTFSIADRCYADNNQSHGFLVTNGTFNPAAQWTLLNCVAQFNGGDGYNVTTTVPTQNLPNPTWSNTNPAYVTLNTWIYCTTFANAGRGFSLNGLQAAPLCDFSLTAGWIGSDGADGLYANTYGINNRLNDTVFELSSTYGSATYPGGIGPNQNIAAPMAGNSINITVNNQDWQIIGGLINQPAFHGIIVTGTATQIIGTKIFNCGLAKYNTYAGIVAPQGHGSILIHGVNSGGPLGGGAQANGVVIYDGSLGVCEGCDLRGNTNVSFFCNTNAILANVGRNLGFISRNAGVTPIPAGTTTLNIAHTLGTVPGIVTATAAGSLPSFFVDTYGNTYFKVTFASATPAASYLAWSAATSAYA